MYVYRNLTKKAWSLMERGKVRGYQDSVLLKDVSLMVREAGHRRVLESGRKNVHAFARGAVLGRADRGLVQLLNAVPARYNPRFGRHFFNAVTGEPLWSARYALLLSDGSAWLVL